MEKNARVSWAIFIQVQWLGRLHHQVLHLDKIQTVIVADCNNYHASFSILLTAIEGFFVNEF